MSNLQKIEAWLFGKKIPHPLDSNHEISTIFYATPTLYLEIPLIIVLNNEDLWFIKHKDVSKRSYDGVSYLDTGSTFYGFHSFARF